MKLKLLFSLIALSFVACAPKEKVIVKRIYIHTKCPKFEYNVTIPKPKKFEISMKDGKIVISKESFLNLVETYTAMKNELNSTQQAIKIYNKSIERINNEHSN